MFRSSIRYSRFLSSKLKGANASAAIRTSSVLASSVHTSTSRSTESTTQWTTLAAVAATLGLVSYNNQSNQQQKAECCGIAGVVGSGKYDARYVIILYSV